MRQAYWFSAVALVASLGLLIVHGLIPEKFEVDETSIALLAIALVALLVPLLPILGRYLREMRIPGVQLSFRDQLEDAARRLSATAVSTEREPWYSHGTLRELPSETAAAAEEDPNVSVARASIELERLMREALGRLELVPQGRPLGLGQMSRILEEAGSISREQGALLRDIVQMRNRAVHGESITRADAALFADVVRRLLVSLDLERPDAP